MDTAVKSDASPFRLERIVCLFDRIAAWGSAAILGRWGQIFI